MMDGAAADLRAARNADRADPHWVVLTPSVDHEAWLRALAKAAADQGRALATVSDPRQTDDPKQGPSLFVTHDAALLVGVDPARVTIIMPQPETAAEATAVLLGLEQPHDAFHASLLLTRALSFPEPARLFSAAQLSRNPETIELFPGFDVRPPVAERGVPRKAVAVAFSMYRQGRPEVGTTAFWSEPLFIYDTRACIEGAPAGVLDISGRSRTLVYGPYLALPSGRWKAVVRFSIDAGGAKQPLRFDWGLAGDFVSQTVTPGAPGVYEIELEQSHDPATTSIATSVADLWQFRIIVMQGVFDGFMTFHGVSVTRLADPEPSAIPTDAGR